MAANYWESTQRKHWQFTKDGLADMRQKLEDEDPGLVSMFPLPQLRHLNIYFNQQINRLGKRLGVRQQAMATAQVYLKRFYSKVEIRRTNPYLVIATAVYLACKMEECPQHIRLVVSEARSLWPSDFIGLDTSKLGEAEFMLISEMSSHLIIHQPYRTLTSLQNDFNLGADEAALAWSIINDHYMTDLPLLYPPHIIALTAMLLAIVLRPIPSGGQQTGAAAATSQGMAAATAALQQAQARAALTGSINTGGSGQNTPSLTPQSSSGLQGLASGGDDGGNNNSSNNSNNNNNNNNNTSGVTKRAGDGRINRVQRFAMWLAESNIDIEAMVDTTQELISFYECYEQYNDKHTREQINRFIKARGLDK
ncbi:cyclin-C [Diplogelasinospora grovesii]|uniref:RNA polymerase II holoenzyme cyclin-like subunit n=1 Tax=Diplogelasinospora grovesii TaxID=303347 RepID=A0AAN6S7R8_9PEZI|nr:cyclin-C [Diplogelasinospora grovesii]